MLQQNNHNIILPKYFDFVREKGGSLALPANGLGGSRATSLSVAHFAKRNTKLGSKKGKVQNPARIPPQTPPAGGKKAERGEKRILGASQGRSATARDGVARFFSRKILVTFHSPRQIVSPCRVRFNHLGFARNSFELCPTNTA